MAATIIQVGEASRVNGTGAQAYTPTISVMADGGWVISWRTESSTNPGPYYQRFDANGTAMYTSDMAVPNKMGGQLFGQGVAALDDGSWVISYTNSVYFDQYRVMSNGTITQSVASSSGQSIFWPVITPVGYNSWTIAWRANAQDGSAGDIYLQYYVPGSARYPTPIRVNTTTAYEQTNPSITGLDDGGWVVTWESANASGFYDVYQQRYRFDGTSTSSDMLVNKTTTSTQSNAKITALADGGWVVTWLSFEGYGSATDIYQQRYRADGTAVYPQDQLVNSYTYGDQNGPTIVALADGGWIVRWYSSRGAESGTYHQRYDASGRALYPSDMLLTEDSDASLAALNDGDWLSTWSDGSGIYQRRNSSATSLTSKTEIATGTADNETFLVEDGGLSQGDRIDGGAGLDTLQSAAGGTLDLTKPAGLTGIETIRGSEDADIVIASAARLVGIWTIGTGAGVDELRLEGGTYDLRGTTFTGVETIVLQGSGMLTLSDKAAALLTQAAPGLSATVIVENTSFTADERSQLYRQGIRIITDASGTYRHETLELSGSGVSQTVAMTGHAKPFADAIITASAGITLTATIVLSDPAHGRLLNLSDGSYDAATGTYTIGGDAVAVQAALRAVTFDPTDCMAAVGAGETTTVSLTVSDGLTDVSSEAQVTSLATNVAPGQPQLTQAWVQEDAAAGTVIGDLWAGDPNPGDTLHFALTDSAGGRFVLNQNNQLVVAPGAGLDYEQSASQQVVVRVTDGGGLTFDRAFTITVGDVAVEQVKGTSGSDVVKGGTGRDVLSGGLGKDILTGGKGQDAFVFNTKPDAKKNLDKITDFSAKDDSIWLENAIFKALGKSSSVTKPALLKSGAFYPGSAAHDKDDRIIYNKKTGALSYDADGTGASKQVQIATLSNKAVLTYKDFFVI